MDMDELDDKTLKDEITRRSDARRNGKCDYCGGERGTPACRFPARHARVEEDVKLTVGDISWIKLHRHEDECQKCRSGSRNVCHERDRLLDNHLPNFAEEGGRGHGPRK